MDWKKIKYFTIQEFADPDYAGSGDLINVGLVYMLDELRAKLKAPIITHWRVGGCVDIEGRHGHALHSYHLLKKGAMACDFHIQTAMDPRKQYAVVESMQWGGLGVYYCWEWGGKLLPVGFHVDLRLRELTQRWVCRAKDDYQYLLGR